MLEKEFVTYEQALALKELGFDEPCLGGYIYLQGSGTFELAFYKDRNVDFNTTSNIYVSAPLYQQCWKWFREKYGLIGHIRESLSFDNTMEYVTQINGTHVNHGLPDKPINRFDTYEEAELACIDKLIQLIKEGKEL